MRQANAAIRENGAASGAGVLATYTYDDLARRTGVARGNNTSEAVTFDTAGRLASLTQNLTGTSQDQTLTFGYNPAGQIVSRTGSNAAYAWAPLSPSTTAYTDNGLNQYTNVGGAAQTYDGRGNLTTGSLSYDIHNRLISGPASATLAYDPGGRLYQTVGAGVTTRFLYDGAQMIGEFNASGVLQRRFVPGPGLDEPVAWYEGAGTGDRRWLAADEHGSVIAVVNASGAASTINSYDEFGARGPGNAGRFQFTGQAWLPEVGMHHMRARAYSSATGRFAQSDPILHAGGMNLYAYVGNDPVNWSDPFGLDRGLNYPAGWDDVLGAKPVKIVVTLPRRWPAPIDPGNYFTPNYFQPIQDRPQENELDLGGLDPQDPSFCEDSQYTLQGIAENLQGVRENLDTLRGGNFIPETLLRAGVVYGVILGLSGAEGPNAGLARGIAGAASGSGGSAYWLGLFGNSRMPEQMGGGPLGFQAMWEDAQNTLEDRRDNLNAARAGRCQGTSEVGQ